MRIFIKIIIVFAVITYIVASCNTAKTPVMGDTIEVQMRYGTPDSVWYNSKQTEKPLVMKMDKPSFKGDFYDIISTMHVGDSASFKCDADSVFIKTFRMPSKPSEFSFIDSISFNVKLISISAPDGNQK